MKTANLITSERKNPKSGLFSKLTRGHKGHFLARQASAGTDRLLGQTGGREGTGITPRS